MELSKDEPIFKKIELINQDIDKNKVILNFHNSSTWTETEFNNFTSILRSNYKETIHEEILEVSKGSTILTINKISGILNYCATNDLKNVIYKWENNDIIKNEIINDLFDIDLEFQVYNRTPIEQPIVWDNEKKKFKYIKEISYDLNNGIIAIVKIIKINDGEFETLKKSKTLSAIQNYEFSLIINDTKNLISSIILVIKSLFMANIILTKKQQSQVLNEYYNLIKKNMDIPSYYKDIPLLAPKPITLEKCNLVNPNEYGAVSILKDYTVTEKADGERILMYINNEGNVYLIDNSLRVEDSGIIAKKEVHNSLIDGEYIRCDKRIDNVKKNIYAAFDIYYINNKCLTSLPLIGGRNPELPNVVKKLDLKKSNFEFVIIKNHYNSGNIINDCREILNNAHKYPYEIDGLIFTPAKLSLYSYYPSVPVPITPNMTWDRSFKWKPPEQNTIDFLIKFVEEVKIDGYKYKKVGLYVGFNPLISKEINIDEGLKLRYDKNYSKAKFIEEKEKKKNGEDYIPILFKPVIYYHTDVEFAFIKIDSKGDIRTEDNNKILNDTIVEFRYDVENKKWCPLRIRFDKTNLYKKGIFGKTANSLMVALSVWRSIHNPISKELITGSKSLFERDVINEGKELDADDVYYTRGIPRKSLLSFNMVTFHNLVINDILYSKPKNRNNLLELACGQASGLSRWLSAGYNFILGIDYAKDNIYKPNDGSYARLINEYNRFNKMNKNKSGEKSFFPNIAFAVGDCSLDIKTGTAGIDEESKELLKLTLNNNYKTNKSHYKYIIGKGASKFDVVSCMFAIHYFFESEGKLEGFLNNVATNIKTNGLFICTFMDGDIVEKELGTEGIVEGRKKLDNSNIVVWAIIKRFLKDDDNYNKKIDVYIENTRKLIPEYLVKFDFLIQKANEFGLELVESELFSQTFMKYRDNIDKNVNKQSSLDKSILELDKDEIQKKFSFFNRWAIFKKID